MKYWRYSLFLKQKYGHTSRSLDPFFIASNTRILRNPLLPSCFLFFRSKLANQNDQVGSMSICPKHSKDYFHKCKG